MSQISGLFEEPTVLVQSVSATADESDEESLDDEAEIYLDRSNGVAVARLTHPVGTQALLDLRGGLVYGWKGLGAEQPCRAGPRVLWPDVLEASEAPPWMLLKMDDANNESSVTVACAGGDWPG